LQVSALRSAFSVVAQDIVIFNNSIWENIRYVNPDASDEEVRIAARAANAESFIDAFPDGFDTQVGERGVQLSGGQKQRVAIARALLKDPRILILDEATSALDAESESLVREALERLMKGRSTLVIAHRLSSVRHADRIAVLAEGRLVQLGDHRTLATQPGPYRTLCEIQGSLDEAIERDVAASAAAGAAAGGAAPAAASDSPAQDTVQGTETHHG